MPSSRVVSREQALKNKFDRQLKVAEKGRQTAKGRKAAISETLDFFVGGAARGIGKFAEEYAKQRFGNQFTSKAAKTVIDDTQGGPKMKMKGFGN